jgi:hypothetical protein
MIHSDSYHTPAFDPTTWEVRESFTHAEFLEAVRLTCVDLPGQLGVRRKIERIALPSPRREQVATILRTREHEFTHFRQHISTPLGAFIHRLCSMREHAAIDLYRSCRGPVPRLPFHRLVMEGNGLPDAARAMLELWKVADLLEGILWCKTCVQKSLKDLWAVAMGAARFDFLSKGPSHSTCRLEFTRALDDQAVPPGTIRVQDLAEGFARYREYRELNVHYGEREALDIVCEGEWGPRRIASDYTREYLGISFDHPLSGALLECALLCFVDPFLCLDSQELQWDAIHPGLAFQHAVQRLASTRFALPKSLHGAYEIAYEAYGLDSNPQWHEARRRIVELTQEPASQAVLDRSDADLPDDSGSIIHEFQRSFFLAALRLRSDHPSIFFEPQLYFPPPWNRFVSVSLPPLLVNPGGIELLRIEDHRSARVNVPLIYHAMTAGVLDDLARHGSVQNSIHFVQTLRKSHPGAFPPSAEPQYFQNILRDSYDESIDHF